jgi:hypothetical protein
MQIHELTSRKRVDENFMTNLAKAAGGAVKGAVGNAVQGVKDTAGQLGAQLKDPKSWISTKSAAVAKGGAQLKQQTDRYAQQLAGEWAQQSKALVGAEGTAKLAANQQATPATSPAGNKSTPTPNIQGGSELQKAQAAGSAARLAVGDKRSELQIAAEPNSIANRQLATEPNKPAVPGAPLNEPISIGGQKLNPKDPKDAKLIAQLKAKGNLEEAFADLPGAKPAAGGAVDPKVTAGVGKQGNPLSSAYITAFKKWADAKLATRESNTGETLTMKTVAA